MLVMSIFSLIGTHLSTILCLSSVCFIGSWNGHLTKQFFSRTSSNGHGPRVQDSKAHIPLQTGFALGNQSK